MVAGDDSNFWLDPGKVPASILPEFLRKEWGRFAERSELLDEVDLKAKSADKPEQLFAGV